MNTKNDTKADSQTDPVSTTTPVRKNRAESGLPPELSELIIELKETVKGINPRRQTPKTLRRALSMVGDILADIDRLTTVKG